MSTQDILSTLRARGISISACDGRLIVEAPEGAVTAELRGELIKSKAELIATLKPPQPRTDGSGLLEAQNAVASLLAMAYRRYAAVPRVGTDRKASAADCGLASAGGSSVHGDVP
jgi:hypothetical protein